MTLYIIKSDQGDGGWSAHRKGTEDEDGIAPVLVSGTAEWDASQDDYNWPTLSEVEAMIAE